MQFFTGFCLVANGAYIGFGSIDGIGDCGEMLRSGTPRWVMQGFAAVTISWGFLLWHRLGSPWRLSAKATIVTPRMAYVAWCLLLIVVAIEISIALR